MKTVLITGATSGFGKLLTETLVQKGHNVIATGRNINDRKSIFQNLESKYLSRIQFIDLDINDQNQRNNLVQQLNSNGTLDVLVNNAGVGVFAPLEETEDDVLLNVIQTNLISMMQLTRD